MVINLGNKDDIQSIPVSYVNRTAETRMHIGSERTGHLDLF
jgi:hypothetical protein